MKRSLLSKTQTTGTSANSHPGSPTDGENYWDFVDSQTSMGRYLTANEKKFIVESLNGYPNPIELALDAGAGTGRHTRIVATYATQVVAMEIEDDLVAALARVAPNVQAVRVTPETTTLPVDSNSTDCILCIEAVFLPEQEWFREECGRVLRPGGMLIVTLQNRLSWKGLWAKLRPGRYRYATGDVYYVHSLGEFSDMFRRVGLELRDALGYNWLPFNRASNSLLLRPLAILEALLQLRRLPSLSPWIIMRFVFKEES